MSSAADSRIATAYARVREHLAYLGLSTVSERLAAELERATTETSAPVEILERLLAAEVGATAARKLAGRLRFAHYPLDKRLAQFEFDYQPSIDRAVIAELSTLRFVEERRNAPWSRARPWYSAATGSRWWRRTPPQAGGSTG
jgi:DNA replication protein DnaC